MLRESVSGRIALEDVERPFNGDHSLRDNSERSYERGPPLSLGCALALVLELCQEDELGSSGEVKVSAAWHGFSVAITLLRVADGSFNSLGSMSHRA